MYIKLNGRVSITFENELGLIRQTDLTDPCKIWNGLFGPKTTQFGQVFIFRKRPCRFDPKSAPTTGFIKLWTSPYLADKMSQPFFFLTQPDFNGGRFKAFFLTHGVQIFVSKTHTELNQIKTFYK